MWAHLDIVSSTLRCSGVHTDLSARDCTEQQPQVVQLLSIVRFRNMVHCHGGLQARINPMFFVSNFMAEAPLKQLI